MVEPRVLGGFVLRFMLIFAVVIVPWRPLETFTRSVFQAEACWLLSLALPQKKIKAEVSQDPQHTTIDTRITLSDLRDVRPDGQAPTQVFDCDSRSLSWIPQAVWLALCGATPVPWPRRLRMALAGLLALQILVGGTILTAIFFGLAQESSPTWEFYGLAGLNHVLMDNLWVSFVVPWVLWIIWVAQQASWPLVIPRPKQVVLEPVQPENSNAAKTVV